MDPSIERHFSFRSVCVLGAFMDPEVGGHFLLRNLLNEDYRGKIYAVNPKAIQVLGIRCCRSVIELPEEIDHAVIALSSNLVYDALLSVGK